MRWFGLVPFRSPLLGKSYLFLWVLRCFSSPGSLPAAIYSPPDTRAFPRVGFPIRTSSVQAVAHTSPKLFAVYRVLHRQLTPRHPPCALSSLSSCDTENSTFSNSSFIHTRCAYAFVNVPLGGVYPPVTGHHVRHAQSPADTNTARHLPGRSSFRATMQPVSSYPVLTTEPK